VLVFENKDSGFAAPLQAAIQRAAPGVPVAVVAVEQGFPADAATAGAVVLSSALALDQPEALRLWLKEYAGTKVVVPVENRGWLWLGGAARHASSPTAQIVRQLADGQEVQPQQAGTAAWQVVAYIFAVLFTIQLALGVLVVAMSLLIH
jgi:hypothetical protein